MSHVRKHLTLLLELEVLAKHSNAFVGHLRFHIKAYNGIMGSQQNTLMVFHHIYSAYSNGNICCQVLTLNHNIYLTMFNDDSPLGDNFLANPLEFMQNYVRGMNNEIFLSEFHINNLYALLLIGRKCPWDGVRPNSINLKAQIDVLVNRKQVQVKMQLEAMSQAYEDKVKKSTLSQIQKLMSIVKAKKKSIFIEKNQDEVNANIQPTIPSHHKKLHDIMSGKSPTHIKIKNTKRPSKKQGKRSMEIQTDSIESQMKEELSRQNNSQGQMKIVERESDGSEEEEAQQQEEIYEELCKKEQAARDEREVFGLFFSLTNISNLSALAIGNFVEHNSTERYIKFRMSKNYVMTIKNEEPVFLDYISALRNVPSQTFIYHVFPYLSASQLFTIRSVCKEWRQNVKESWHSTFKREMFVQLLACEFCKDIEFNYKIIQLRNPFFQKLSLLIHALVQIIQWDTILQGVNNNSLPLVTKRTLIVILKLLGEPINLTNVNSLDNAAFNLYKHKTVDLKARSANFFNNMMSNNLTIEELREIKIKFLDDHFMRADQIQNDDKTSLLLSIYMKQIVLQQILRNHIFIGQEFLLNTKKRLDRISSKMTYQKGYLQGVYKILLLKSAQAGIQDDQNQPSQMPNLHKMLQSMFSVCESSKPDFVLKSKGGSSTQIYLDKATKFDLIINTFKNIAPNSHKPHHHHQLQQNNEPFTNEPFTNEPSTNEPSTNEPSQHEPVQTEHPEAPSKEHLQEKGNKIYNVFSLQASGSGSVAQEEEGTALTESKNNKLNQKKGEENQKQM